ncbi:MAG: ornithine carbamoyltransferase [Patescibacteria group bacterium]|jgi:ornithine carbamoyltransferase
MKKDFLSITDLTKNEIIGLINLSIGLKEEMIRNGSNVQYLKNRTLTMIFEKPSLRTRISFETAMTQLGGHAINLTQADIGMGKRESVIDVAKVISSMTDIVMARVFEHSLVKELAKYSSVPVINGLSDLEHPCQILSDLLTIYEIKNKLKGLKIVYFGDGENNISHSLLLASSIFGMNFTAVCPKDYWMNRNVVKKALKIAKKNGSQIIETNDPKKAALNADIIYTDTWISMGDEKEKEKRLNIFPKYQVTAKLMGQAKNDVIFMHDLPAYRNYEVSPEVIDGKQSVVYQQAENRLHAQKALLIYLLNNSKLT